MVRASDLVGGRLAAMDGASGAVDDCLLDDRDWTVRDLVVHLGIVRRGRRVLVAPASVHHVDPAGRRVVVLLSKGQVAASPDADGAPGTLHSTRGLTGYRLEASDGIVGHVDDFLIDETSWAIRSLVVEILGAMPSRKVALPPQWIVEVARTSRTLRGDQSREVREAPAYRPEPPVHRGYDRRIIEPIWRPAVASEGA